MTFPAELRRPIAPERPRAVEPELLVPLAERWLPISEVERQMRALGVDHMTLPGTLSSEQLLAYRRLRGSKYFLVRNRGFERYRCADPRGHMCGGMHEFFTFMGVDRPFRGLEGALWGYAQISRDTRLSHKVLGWAPHLDAGHPYLADSMAPKEPGSDLIAVAIGVLEGISKTYAETLMQRINAKIRTPGDRIVL